MEVRLWEGVRKDGDNSRHGEERERSKEREPGSKCQCGAGQWDCTHRDDSKSSTLKAEVQAGLHSRNKACIVVNHHCVLPEPSRQLGCWPPDAETFIHYCKAEWEDGGTSHFFSQSKNRSRLLRRPLGYPRGKQKSRITNLTCSRQRVGALLLHFSRPRCSQQPLWRGLRGDSETTKPT